MSGFASKVSAGRRRACDVDGHPQAWVGAERAGPLTSVGVSSAADGDRFQNRRPLCTEAVVWDA